MTLFQDLAGRTQDEMLKRLLSYLAADPANPALRRDAAAQALDCGTPEIARLLLEAEDPALGDEELNLLGLAHMQERAFGKAARTFERLAATGADDPAVRFNLAWSLAMEQKLDQALVLLDPEVTGALPQAAMLQVQLLHQAGEFDRAAQAARAHIATFPDDQGLAAAVSVLALDIEDLELAKCCARKAPGHPDALTTLGTLALGDSEVGAARALFDQALSLNERVPRAWIGRGLARLLNHEPGGAADIDRGAELFGDHLGSWIAAGWAHLVAGERGLARERFERALRIDDNFGESHGSLAVLDALEGHEKEAAKRIAVARRLDPGAFSAAFAQTLLAAAKGDQERARNMLEKILETPVNQRGDTAAQALLRMGLR
jgi:tetratricopeptide (TPR) repeat protein